MGQPMAAVGAAGQPLEAAGAAEQPSATTGAVGLIADVAVEDIRVLLAHPTHPPPTT
eukprot:COSAG01_NODE_15472_length_1333_cov_1.514587_1_plen_57_part_00